MFDAPTGAQMSFFPSEAEQIQSIAEAESVTPSAFSMFISQNDIDHILRAGGNTDAARMKIAAEFSKQKPLEDRVAFLKALYYGGNGLITDNGRLSAWYGDDGIHIATGDTSRYLRSAQVIGWADAAERIEELLDGGAFATNLEVTEARAMSGWVLLWMSGTFITISRMKQSRWGICPAWVISIAPAFQRKRSV